MNGGKKQRRQCTAVRAGLDRRSDWTAQAQRRDMKLQEEKGRVGDSGNERSGKGKEICAVRSSWRGNYGDSKRGKGERAGTRRRGVKVHASPAKLLDIKGTTTLTLAPRAHRYNCCWHGLARARLRAGVARL